MADFPGRQSVSTEGKARLFGCAAQLIEEGQLVFLHGGTTNVALAHRLPPDLAVTVITHRPSIAVVLTDHPTIDVELIGGRLFKHSVVAVGAAAASAIRRVRPDLFVMGVTGLHPEVGATTGDSEEAEIKALIAAQSAETMVLASAEKLGSASPYLIAPAAELATVVVEASTSSETVNALRLLGLRIVLA